MGVLPSAAYRAAASSRSGVQARIGEQPGGANEDLAAVDGGLDPFASDRGKPDNRRQGQAALADRCADRGREGCSLLSAAPTSDSRVASSKPLACTSDSAVCRR